MFARTRSVVALLFATLSVTACERLADQLSANSFSGAPDRTAAAPVAPRMPAGAPANASPAPTSPASVSADAISDSIITAKIKSAILSDPGMSGADVSVNTDRGVVSLNGVVKSPEQAAIASAYAQRQDGVLRVDNQLSFNPR